MNYQDFVERDFKGCGGREGFRGMREAFRAAREDRREHFKAAFGEFGRGRHGGRGPRGFGWGGRMFAGGDLRYVILQLISEKPSYGYEIIKSIQ